MIESNDFIYQINQLRIKYLSFLNKCKFDEVNFSFSINGEQNAFARCFAIFGYNLLNETNFLEKNKKKLIEKIIFDLENYYKSRKRIVNSVYEDKPFLQLLTFSLSALNILGYLKNNNPFKKHISKILEINIIQTLNKKGFKEGKAQSGNFAMFYGILLIYSINYLNNKEHLVLLKEWCSHHTNSLNKFGFWGNFKNINYAQFQNGFHQYVIFDYLKLNSSNKDNIAESVIHLIDQDGHFAPYPGGGGCFDYDAIYFLMRADNNFIKKNKQILINLIYSIINLQDLDGGFSESKNIRPRNIKNLMKFIKHLFFSPNNLVRKEKLKYFITLQRNKHNKIINHWSAGGYGWSESNLWDSWFRVMVVAAIDNKLKITNLDWKYTNFPGIGYNI